MNGWMDAWIDGKHMDEWMENIWMNGWMDRWRFGILLARLSKPPKKEENITNHNLLSFIFEPVIPKELDELLHSLQHNFLLLNTTN